MFIIIVGNPVDGMIFCGPFEDTEEASEYAELHFKNDDWWITSLEAPKRG